MVNKIFKDYASQWSATYGCTCVGGLILSRDQKEEFGRVEEDTYAVSTLTGERVLMSDATEVTPDTYLVWSEAHQAFLFYRIEDGKLSGFVKECLQKYSVTSEKEVLSLCRFVQRFGKNYYEGKEFTVRITAHDEHRVLIRAHVGDDDIDFIFNEKGSLIPNEYYPLIERIARLIALEVLSIMDIVVYKFDDVNFRYLAKKKYPELCKRILQTMEVK